MSKPLRFTGEDPPLHLWARFPNWRNALEEEGEEGQDETTLMPDEVQTRVGEYTSLTAGRARFNDGREFHALLEIGDHRIDGCSVYQAKNPWRIYFSCPDRRWLSFRAEWLPEAERPPSVLLDDEGIFPLEIFMTLPWREGEKPSVYQIGPDGQIKVVES